MSRISKILIAGAILFAAISAALGLPIIFSPKSAGTQTAAPPIQQAQESTLPSPSLKPEIKFVGPRQNIPEKSPADYGFWSFAVSVPNILSRSGQPLAKEFSWLKQMGWKGVVNLRVDGERGEIGDDLKVAGFKDLGLNYLHLPIADGSAPTQKQAEEFLAFATDPANQPLHAHCRGGIGRAGTMVALFRYAAQGWPMEKAIEESRLFQGGVSDSQKMWLLNWAKNSAPGSWQK